MLLGAEKHLTLVRESEWGRPVLLDRGENLYPKKGSLL